MLAIQAGIASGELCHPLPFFPEFWHEMLFSDVADMKVRCIDIILIEIAMIIAYMILTYDCYLYMCIEFSASSRQLSFCLCSSFYYGTYSRSLYATLASFGYRWTCK